MILHPPFIITPSLMAGVQIGNAFLSIEYSKRPGRDNRTRYHWQLVLPGLPDFDGENLQSGCGGGSLQGGMESLLFFLGAAGESYRHNGNAMKEDTNTDLFPEAVCEWAYIHSDELSLLGLEIEESEKALIEE